MPIVKWPGGKARALKYLLPVIREGTAGGFDTYHEPFVGGGAVFFALQEQGAITHAVLSDGNAKLIRMYRGVRDNVDEVTKVLTGLASSDSARQFRVMRARFNQMPMAWSDTEFAAVFIYLNRAGYNGLYRENSRGDFNTPFAGPPHRELGAGIIYVEELRKCAEALQCAELRHSSFEDSLVLVEDGDLVYADPPYYGTSSQMYSAGSFGEEEQRFLATGLGAVADDEALVVASNSDTEFTREIYSEQGFAMRESRRVNSINRNSDDRSPKADLIFTSF